MAFALTYTAIERHKKKSVATHADCFLWVENALCANSSSSKLVGGIKRALFTRSPESLGRSMDWNKKFVECDTRGNANTRRIYCTSEQFLNTKHIWLLSQIMTDASGSMVNKREKSICYTTTGSQNCHWQETSPPVEHCFSFQPTMDSWNDTELISNMNHIDGSNAKCSIFIHKICTESECEREATNITKISLRSLQDTIGVAERRGENNTLISCNEIVRSDWLTVRAWQRWRA